MSKLRNSFYLIIFLLLGLFLIKLSALIFSTFKSGIIDNFTLYIFAVATNVLVVILLGILNGFFAKFVSHERLKDIGWDLHFSSIRLFFIGSAFIIAIASLVGAFSIYMLAISYRVKIPANKALGLIFLYVVSTLFQCIGEELWMRSWFLSNFTRFAGKRIALITSGVGFGALHLLNSNYNWFGVLNAIFAGIMLSAAFIKTNSIWLPIGLHFGWNMVLGLMFNNQIFKLSSPLLTKISQFTAAEGTWWGVVAILFAALFVISDLSDEIFVYYNTKGAVK